MADQNAPLAYRLRPTTLDAFFGQTEVIGEGTALRKAIDSDTLSSVIFAGPPGTGKTTLAKIIAQTTNHPFFQLSAVTSGIKDIKEVCAPSASGAVSLFSQRKVLFIDEIHRFNKTQQDALLPYVENGSVILIGATTENPYFSVNNALLSRSQVYLFKPHSADNLSAIIKRALVDKNGYDGKIKMTDDTVTYIAGMADGDARRALNLLEVAVLTIGANITLEQAEKLLKQRNMRYDKNGEDHYDTISAFIKTMRGSDIDAALVWLYKMIVSGEEPRFLFRRMAIFASEDIGNADPRALQIVMSAWQAFEFVGFPEGEYFLAHACVYLAQAPKSNSVTRAMGAARKAVESAAALEVPYHLRNAADPRMKQHGHGAGYQYAHKSDSGVVADNYFPIGMPVQNFYDPSDRGFEADIAQRWQKTKEAVRGGEEERL
ncbi:MAG: replication-associated recombination protein A [Candidatus Peribacteraceae bacterium]|nr:replication-associated recombination protein A [Candidatus Peribacteraceae bacterium]